MKRIASLMAAVSLLIFMGITTASAETKASASKDERKLNSEITMLNSEAKLPHGDKVMMEQLTKTFDVKNDKIRSLRDRNLGYGEIATVLAFADKMSGGLNDANINKVMSLRQGATAWSQIASSLKINLGDIADKVSSFEDDAHKDIKKAASEKPEAGAGAGGGVSEDSSAIDQSGSGAGGESGKSTTGGKPGEPAEGGRY